VLHEHPGGAGRVSGLYWCSGEKGFVALSHLVLMKLIERGREMVITALH